MIQTILTSAIARQAEYIRVTGKPNVDIATTIEMATRLLEREA